MNATLRKLAESLGTSLKGGDKSAMPPSAVKPALAREIRVVTAKETLVEANFHVIDYGNAT
jgi:hypothetical protein